MLDANYVVASKHPQPWRKQLNIMAAYLCFYNPLRLLLTLVRPKGRLYLADGLMQPAGMWGLIQTVRRTFGWAVHLMRGDIRRQTRIPSSPIPMHSTHGAAESPALLDTSPGGFLQPEVRTPTADRAAEHVPQVS